MRGFLSLGSNLGDRKAYLQDALKQLATKGIEAVRISRIYETSPVEVFDEQGSYFNTAVEFSFDGEPMELLDICQAVEAAIGRTRPYVHAPRTIDIDVLLIQDEVVSNDRLTVPHPRMEQRAFVIFPLAEIAPELILPSGRKIDDIKRMFKDDEIIRIRDW